MLVIFSFHNICGAMKRNFSCELPQKRCKFNGRPTKVQRKQYIMLSRSIVVVQVWAMLH